ncbi:amiloride-sensitive sodium channel subunit gamma-like [Dendronephthya gigantea]|uniref:amiloride-sensitive sodium channel subunit gamma-like n=1 Tax=Dendronephthya gigantea TaxID=151771 RepID=UPI00106A242B|nr:amiloride-sensitive sodium channel subunit gamma-like [Dendronephthya gigantea]
MESYSMDPVVQRKVHASSQNNLADDSNEKNSETKGPRKIINRFFHYTTINGLQRLASAGTILGRLFWIAVVLGAAALFSKDIYDLVQQFYSRPVSVVSKIEYFRGMEFPAVTFCNVNPIRKSEVSAKLKEKIEERDNNTCFREDLRGKNSKCEEDNDEEEEFENEIDHILSAIDEETLVKSGHQLGQFIVSCRFNGKRCRNEKYWVRFWDPYYGNCFTLNSLFLGRDPNIPSFKANKPGSSYGLKLVFNLQLDEYIPQLTKDAGIKVSITERDEMPFPIYNSLSLAPGFNNEIAMKRTKIERIDRFENGSCQASRALGEKNPYRIKYGAGYSVQACLQYCYAQSQIQKCGCAEYSFSGAAAKGKICNENDETSDACIDKWKDADSTCENDSRFMFGNNLRKQFDVYEMAV